MVRHCSFIPLIFALLTAGWRGGPAREFQIEKTAYDNLPDPRLVTLLKAIADKPGRTDVFPQEGRYLYDLILKNKLTFRPGDRHCQWVFGHLDRHGSRPDRRTIAGG